MMMRFFISIFIMHSLVYSSVQQYPSSDEWAAFYRRITVQVREYGFAFEIDKRREFINWLAYPHLRIAYDELGQYVPLNQIHLPYSYYGPVPAEQALTQSSQFFKKLFELYKNAHSGL